MILARDDASAPVTGKTRLQAAWGSSTGDEVEDMGMAALPKTGEIFHQDYKPWTGTLNPRWMRNWAILRHHLFGIFRKGYRPWGMPTRIFLVIVFIASLTDAALTILSGILGSSELYQLWGVNRNNLYGHNLGFFPRNILYYPIVTALLVGGVISEDRHHGTSALYFSRPISRFDYTAMKFISVALIQSLIILGSYILFYFSEIIAMGRGWAWIVDTFPIFIAGFIAGVLLIFTYTSLGLAMSSISRGRFFPGIGLLAFLFGSKTIAAIISGLFKRDILYLLSPYDCLAHVGQALVGTQLSYTQYSWTWSLVSLVMMNGVALYVLASRVSSMEVTRE